MDQNLNQTWKNFLSDIIDFIDGLPEGKGDDSSSFHPNDDKSQLDSKHHLLRILVVFV